MQAARVAVLASLIAFAGWGFATTFFITTPFWIDEWRVIYNLKTRSVPALWAPLDYLQQFPRAYLSVIKLFTAAFDYSYWSLRLPSLMVSTGAVVLAWRVMLRLFPVRDWLRFLFVAVIISSPPVTRYFVQVKQYPMDIALALLAVWQGLEVLRLLRGERATVGRYAALCAGFLIAAFCSYMYPLAIAPVFVLVGIVIIRRLAKRSNMPTMRVVLPLLLGVVALAVFYWVDARHVVSDAGMRGYWHYKLAEGMSAGQYAATAYWVFAQVGAGDLFNIVFGVLGLASFGWTCVQVARAFRRGGSLETATWMRSYSLIAMGLAWILFLAGKLPLGEARLNTFLTPAIAWMLVDFLRALHQRRSGKRIAAALGLLLYAGVLGNLFTTIAAVYTDPDWPKKRLIYATVGKAVKLATARGLPILATPGIAFPEERHDNLPFPEKMPGDWPLKTHPAYHFADSIRVYRLARTEDAAAVLQGLPTTDTAAVVCDGLHLFVVARSR